MTNEILQEVVCPNCQNPIDVREHGQHVTCDACRSRFILRGHLCPQCHRYHAQEHAFCGTCGTPLQRVCVNCSSNNWAGDEFCANCGEAMDIFELLALQQTERRQEHLVQRREQIRALREQEELASAQRMSELEAEAEAYRRELRRRQAHRREEERRMLTIGLVAAVVFILIVTVYALVTLL